MKISLYERGEFKIRYNIGPILDFNVSSAYSTAADTFLRTSGCMGVVMVRRGSHLKQRPVSLSICLTDSG